MNDMYFYDVHLTFTFISRLRYWLLKWVLLFCLTLICGWQTYVHIFGLLPFM